MVHYFERQGHWRDWADTHQIALAAARRQSDRNGQARAYTGLSRACRWLGQFGEALAHLGRLCAYPKNLVTRRARLRYTFTSARHDPHAHRKGARACRAFVSRPTGWPEGRAKASATRPPASAAIRARRPMGSPGWPELP